MEGDSPDPVTELVLLQELFREVLEVPLREGDVGSDGQLVELACIFFTSLANVTDNAS